MKIQSGIDQYKRKKILNILKNTPSDKFEASANKKVLKTLRSAYFNSPAYRQVLDSHHVHPTDIKDISDFHQKIPVLDKTNYFNQYSYSELLGKNIKRMKLAMSSSGFSGNFAFGFSSEEALKSGRLGVDATLDYWFDITNRKTFLINCAPMGVHVETSLPLAETSVRSDMALSLLKKVSPDYDQTIIAGDPHFLKKLIEEGETQKINWEQLQVSLITAQDWLPESLRTYMADLLKIDVDNIEHRGIYSTMGMTELGLNVFHESKYSIALRRTAIKDDQLKNTFNLQNSISCPYFFHYYPFRSYIESRMNDGHDELLFTVVDNKSILPILRYSTGDSGRVLKYEYLKKELSKNHSPLLPDLKIPLAIMSGRKSNKINLGNKSLCIEDIKEVLYADFQVASSITGSIVVKSLDNRIHLSIHLKDNVSKDKTLEKRISQNISDQFHVENKVELLNYYDFPNGLELNYEKKLST